MALRSSMLTLATLLISWTVYAQPQITGALCVIPETDYDYYISGNPDLVTEISICIKGGSFIDTKKKCKTIKPQSTVKINWDEKAKNAEMTLSYPGGETELKINVTSLLNAGEITSATKKQKLKYDSASVIITCSPASGGSCAPVYAYQWQQSPNALGWSDIAGEQQEYLPSQVKMKEPVFYRRKVAELVSGSVGYSTIATTFVDADDKSKIKSISHN